MYTELLVENSSPNPTLWSPYVAFIDTGNQTFNRLKPFKIVCRFMNNEWCPQPNFLNFLMSNTWWILWGPKVSNAVKSFICPTDVWCLLQAVTKYVKLSKPVLTHGPGLVEKKKQIQQYSLLDLLNPDNPCIYCSCRQ